MIKRSIHQKDIMSTNTPNNRVLKYIKQNSTNLKGETDNVSIIMRGFKISFSTIEEQDRRTRRKQYLNGIINKQTQKTSREHSTAEKKNTFFSNTHGTFCRVDHMLGHKISLNKFKRIKMTQSMFSNDSGMKLGRQRG